MQNRKKGEFDLETAKIIRQ